MVSEIIAKDDAEIYFIGFQCGLSLITNVACVLFAGAFMHIFAESVTFILSFYMLRIVANGFHTKSIDSCFWFSCAVEFAVLLGIKNFPINMTGAIIIAAVMVVILSKFCPVPNENKQYTEKESKIFRKLGLLVFGIEIAVGIVFLLMNLSSLYSAILYSWALYSLLNVLGHIQNSKKIAA